MSAPGMTPAPAAATHPLERLALWALGAAMAVGGVVWIGAEASGALSHGRAPRLGLSDVGQALPHLSDALADPRRAFPPAVQPQLASGPLFWLVTAGVAVVALAVGVGLWRLVGRRRRPEQARWARRADLRDLIVAKPEPGRLVLGRSGGRLVATEERQSVIVIGPTQTGKTTGLGTPAILEWDGPVLATSVKDDLVADTIAWRRGRPNAQVFLYDPTGTTRRPATTWSPLSGVTGWSGAQRVASWLAGASQSKVGIEEADFWYLAAEKLLAPYLYAAHLDGADMATVVGWIDTQDEQETKDILVARGEAGALASAQATWRREPRQRSSIFSTAEIILRAFEDPVVAASAASSEFDLARFLDGGAHTLYLCAPLDEQNRLRPLFATLVHQVIAGINERALGRQRLKAPLLVVLDEAANIAPLRDLDKLASTAAGQDIQLVTIWQDFAQIKARYGERAQTVLNNHRAKVVLSGISDPATLDYLARLVGDHEVSRISTTIGADGARSNTDSVIYRQLAPADAVRRVVPGRGILVYGHYQPAPLELRPWYRDRELRRRVEVDVADAPAPPLIEVVGGERAEHPLPTREPLAWEGRESLVRSKARDHERRQGLELEGP